MLFFNAHICKRIYAVLVFVLEAIINVKVWVDYFRSFHYYPTMAVVQERFAILPSINSLPLLHEHFQSLQVVDLLLSNFHLFL